VNLEFYCPLWGRADQPFHEFCTDVRDAGYQGVELPFPLEKASRDLLVRELNVNNLKYIAQHWETFEPDFGKHLTEYKARLLALADTHPEFISSQSGRDWFGFEQNMEILELAESVSRETGVRILHETHRGRMTFAAHTTREYLIRKEDLRLTLDISHWCNVAESMLDDQKDAIDLAISRTDHIHARVGFQESSQVPDPFAPEWNEILQKHLQWWSSVIQRAREEGRETFTITNEFGPYPYMIHLPYTRTPIADQWTINKNIKNLLQKVL